MNQRTWPAAFPKPVPRHEDGPFWDSLAGRRMALQRCRGCGHVRYPSGSHCPQCLSEDAEWRPVSGRAELVSWCTFHRKYLAAFEPPHTVGVGRLEEGPLFVAVLLDGHPPDGSAGRPLRVDYVEDPEGSVLAAYRIADERHGGGGR